MGEIKPIATYRNCRQIVPSTASFGSIRPFRGAKGSQTNSSQTVTLWAMMMLQSALTSVLQVTYVCDGSADSDSARNV